MKYVIIDGNLFQFTDNEWKRYLAFQMASKTYKLSSKQNLGRCPSMTDLSHNKDNLGEFIKETLGPSGFRQVQNLANFLSHLQN